MRATFMNKLVFAEPGQETAIRYMHQFRADVEIHVKLKNRPDRDWDLFFTSPASRIPDDIRQGLMREFVLYVRRRVKKGIHTLEYKDFVDMTKSLNIA